MTNKSTWRVKPFCKTCGGDGKTGATPEHGVTAPRDISRFVKPQTNYFCGSGEMDCPICRTGKLQYTRAVLNGHVFAKCSTDGCVAWRE